MNPLRHLSSLTMRSPTVRDRSLPATPRRIRMKEPHPAAGEILDFYVGRSFFAMVRGRRIEVNSGTYVGWCAIISHEFILMHPEMWDKVEEPFHIVQHI